MAHVVFLRGVNVGGNKVFRPAVFAAKLKHLDLVNIGAAGTFIVRAKVPVSVIRAEILKRLPFEPAISIRPGKEILALVKSDPFKGVSIAKQRRNWAAALCGKPKARPKLPIVVNARSGAWTVRLERVEGAFALGMWHWRPGGFVFPSDVVERAVGVAATTRWWETFVKVAAVLEKG